MKNIVAILILISITFCAVNAATCEELTVKIQNDTICQAGDQDCKAALDTLKYYIMACSLKTSQVDRISCAKNNTNEIKNITVKSFFNELLSCQDNVSLF